MKLGCLVPVYFFSCLFFFFEKFINFTASILSGKFEFMSGKRQGILVSPKCMNHGGQHLCLPINLPLHPF